uniref:Complement component c3a, duplicate 6 n=1 Tax=Cyprinus carpio TaxID=7962 RepID=A0A8C1RIC0_CYPCA
MYVLSAPNLLRVGSSENVFVEAQDYSGGDLNVRIIVKNHPKKNVEILSKSVTLTAANNFQILTDMKVMANFILKQYVYLQAQFPSFTLEKVVMLSFQSGYIFVQTDKPIYTPASTETIFPQQGIRSGKYAVPQPASPGIWKVVTRFTNTPQKNYTADFEVKEYVLPTYEVTLSLSQSFFCVKDASLTVSIEAKYLHRNNVNGHAFVVFGVMEDERKTSIPSSLQRVQISDGEGNAKLTKEMILQTFPDINQLVGRSIYISVSVLSDTGSEMVEAQRRGIQIVTSPYTIHFKKTPQFFKPGMPFDVSVYITDPDQMPAENIEVEVNPGAVRGRTRANGIAKLTVNSYEGSSTLEITVQTKQPKLDDDQQAVRKMTAQAYKTKGGSNNYLHIGIDAAELQISDQMKVNLNLGRSPGVRDQDFTYMILSKGHIVQADRFKRRGQSLVTLSLPVTKDMVPSFRFVAYYHVGSSEVVSDSVWVDVKDTCMGTLKVQVKEPRPIYEPGESFSLQITGDPGAKVGLMAVDKAVHGLNQNRLTQTKIWDVIEKHDIGCTAGGGRDSMGVFTDAGLMFESNTAGGTNTRTVPECLVPLKRRRRATLFYTNIVFSAAQYSGDLRKCCVDGMRDNKLGYTCERRAMYIVDGHNCVQAFLHCCQDVEAHSMEAGEEEMILARSEDSDYYENFDEITSRTQFPESWLWAEEILPVCPEKNKLCGTMSITRDRIYLKESITTWQIFAVSLSKTHGICVADPYEMIVYKRFFIDLKVPYSAIRNEQLQIRAILHNYTKKKIRARLEFMETEHICSSASKKGMYQTEVEVESMSSRSIPHVIIPLELGNHWIEVKAAAYDSVYTDGVKKILKVSEGVLTKVQEANVESSKPDTQVPNTPANTYITVTSQEFSKLIEQAISGDIMGRFIVQPRGNGEENMIGMTLPLIATHYLDSTNQWETVGMDRRNEAVNHINTVVFIQCFLHLPSLPVPSFRQRLTAYVAKVFVMASDLIVTENHVICSALTWLATKKQLPDGTFKEDAPVIHQEMLGNVHEKDDDASLTAFVLISMQEGSKICAGSVSNLESSMKKAVDYLLLRVHSLTSTYAVAMTSYALANAGKLNKDILKSTFWRVPGAHHHSLEATGYALLALVKVKDFQSAGAVVRWLRAQRTTYGGHGSTQASIIVFQAVAEYRMEAKKQDVNLNVELSVEGRKTHNKWTFTSSNKHVTRSDKVKDKFNQSNSIWTSSQVFSLYYALPEERENDCNAFDLSVRMKKEHGGRIITLHVCMQLSSLGLETFIYLFILKKLIILSIKDLSKGKEKYIERFEMNTELSERGSLIIFLNKVSHKERERIAFRMHKINEVGMLQPAGVTVYEYNAPDDRCVKFYHPRKKDGALNRLCHEDLCQCAEENCSLQKKHDIKESQRAYKACAPGSWDLYAITYFFVVYKTRVVGMELSLQADIYNMTIEQVLKEGTEADVEGKIRSFLAHPYCREFLDFQEGKTYLIMGQTTSLPRIGGRLRYSLGEDTWIEYWPTQEEAQTPKYRDKHIGIKALADELYTSGCTT